MEIKIHLSLRNFLIGILLIFLIVFPIWSYFPLIFSKIINHTLGDISLYGENLGSIGDIYGSLNTLVSSIALLAVAFTTYLQVISLKETRNSNNKQLSLAKQSHEAQIKESKSAIFSNLFYSLLNLKFDKYKELTILHSEELWKADKIFINLSDEFQRLLVEEWQDINSVNDQIIREKFEKFLNVNGDHASDTIFSYFTLTTTLIRLIIRSDLEELDKQFFFEILANSMTLHEQITLFWIAPCVNDFYDFLKGTGLFSQFYTHEFVLFGLKFYDKSYFSEASWFRQFEVFDN